MTRLPLRVYTAQDPVKRAMRQGVRMNAMGLREALATYLRDQARRRKSDPAPFEESREGYLRIPGDARRDVGEEALLDAAAFVEQLAETDTRLSQLRLAGYYTGSPTVFTPGKEGEKVVQTWGLDRTVSVSPEKFLESLQDAAVRDGGQGAPSSTT
jgi:hypothetical protein